MKIKSPYLVKPHTRVRLTKIASSDTGDFKSEDAAKAVLAGHRAELAGLQDVFYASQAKALLVVLQGMDTSGKDGTISHIFSGINPQIFNRSHYEDVLSPRVHKLISRDVANQRLEDINEFESYLADNDVLILKFSLHISKDEQTRRLQARIDNPKKHWKLSDADIHERQFWPKYIDAHDDILSTTSRKHAPWFVIPSDNKWYRNIAISTIIVDLMQSLKLKYPKPTIDVSAIKL